MFGLEQEDRRLAIDGESFEDIKALGEKIQRDPLLPISFKMAGMDLVAAGMRCKIELLQMQIKAHDNG
jgi:hypothetical protein